MQLAVDASGGAGEPAAWTRVQLGKLFFSGGRTDAAAREYRIALAVSPGYVHALDALAQVEAARGRLAGDRARASGRRATPLPQFVGFLGDLYRRTGSRGSPASSRASSARSTGSSSRTASRRISRPRSSTSTTACGCGVARARSRALRDGRVRGGRRPGVGARAQRPMRRGAALLEARAPARHARRAQVLPPRHDRALPRPRGGPAMVPPRARRTPISRSLGAGRAEVRRVKRLAPRARARPRCPARRGASATRSATSRSTATAGIELSGDRIYVLYVLDLAEIPTFQERAARPPAAASPPSSAGGSSSSSTAAAPRCDVRPARRAAPRRGGLKTLRFDAVSTPARADAPRVPRRELRRRIGWREVVVRASRGARLVSATAPDRSISNELRATPKDLLVTRPHDDRATRRSSRVTRRRAAAARRRWPRSDRTNRLRVAVGRDDLSLG